MKVNELFLTYTLTLWHTGNVHEGSIMRKENLRQIVVKLVENQEHLAKHHTRIIRNC